jgi:hypothetical protein
VTGVDNTTVELTGSKPATMYTVAVRAFTKIGPGPLGDPMNQTTNNESSKFICSFVPSFEEIKIENIVAQFPNLHTSN